MHCHEIDCLGRRLFRRHDQVAFILPVRVVRYDDKFPGGDVHQDIVDRVEFKIYRRFRNHPPTITSVSSMGKRLVVGLEPHALVPERGLGAVSQRRLTIVERLCQTPRAT